MIGIYKITNNFNEKVYIGQSKTIGQRWANHLNRLECGKHMNKNLQMDFNECGYNNFVFKIECECEEDELLKLEREYIELNKHNSYNIINNDLSKENERENYNNTTKINNQEYQVDKILSETKIPSCINAQRILLMAYKKYYEYNDNYIEISAKDFSKEYGISDTVFYRDSKLMYNELKENKAFDTIKLEGTYLFLITFNERYINTNSYFNVNLIDLMKNTNNKRTLNILLSLLSINKNKTNYSLEDFRDKFMIKGKSYDKFGNIKLKIIDPIIDDINSYTKFNIRIETVKRNNKVVGVSFIKDVTK